MYDASPKAIGMIRDFLAGFPRCSLTCGVCWTGTVFSSTARRESACSPKSSRSIAATGPVARASGVTRDLRKDEPYSAYGDFDFRVCCATAGDCYSRYLVRMAEMEESMKIIKQAIENLPPGPVNVGPEARTILPIKGQVFSTIEGLDIPLRTVDEQSRIPRAQRGGLFGDRIAQR